MHVYVHIYDDHSLQNMISGNYIAIATSIFGLVLNAFWKKSYSYICKGLYSAYNLLNGDVSLFVMQVVLFE